MINHLYITWPTHIAAEEGKNAVLYCWALYRNKTTVKNIFQSISVFLDGKTCVPEPSQDVILHHKQSLQSAVPLQFCLFSKIQISQTLKEFLVERRDKESECGCHFTAKPPSSLLLWRALNTDMVYLWGVKIEPNFYVQSYSEQQKEEVATQYRMCLFLQRKWSTSKVVLIEGCAAQLTLCHCSAKKTHCKREQ